VPGGLAPGAAVVYFTLAALECAALAGTGPSLRAEAEAAVPTLERLAEEWQSLAAELAAGLRGRIAVVHGGAVARRWAAQIEALGGVPAFARATPAPEHDALAAISPEEHAQGDTPLERVLSLVLLGDLVAVYLSAA
jgi:hypothetical protein